MFYPLRLLAAVLAAGLSGCSGIPFHPSPVIHATPEAVNLPYEEVSAATRDGETITGWFVPGPSEPDRPGSGLTLLLFHGNAGNISHCLESIRIFHNLGLAVLVIDYRGFGRSTGKPSVPGVLLDADAAWDWLAEEKGLAPEDVIIFGRSLGGGVAAALAEKTRPRALILESTFTSLYAVGKAHFPWAPVKLFLPDDFDVPAFLANIHAPLLVLHSPDDEVIDYDLGRSLYERYTGPKQFVTLIGPHNTGFLEDRKRYVTGLEEFLRQLGRENAAPGGENSPPAH